MIGEQCVRSAADPLANPDALTLDDGTGPQTMAEKVDEDEDPEGEE